MSPHAIYFLSKNGQNHHNKKKDGASENHCLAIIFQNDLHPSPATPPVASDRSPPVASDLRPSPVICALHQRLRPSPAICTRRQCSAPVTSDLRPSPAIDLRPSPAISVRRQRSPPVASDRSPPVTSDLRPWPAISARRQRSISNYRQRPPPSASDLRPWPAICARRQRSPQVASDLSTASKFRWSNSPLESSFLVLVQSSGDRTGHSNVNSGGRRSPTAVPGHLTAVGNR